MWRQGAGGAGLAAACVVMLFAASPALAASPAPYGQHDAGGFLNVLPAGEAGVDNAGQLLASQTSGAIPPHFNDQLPLYANLVYADPRLTPAQVPNYFKDATFGIKPENVQSSEQPDPTGHPGLTVVRDQYDVPHIYGANRADVEFGAGWIAAEDRLFMIDVLRHVARAQLSSFVGGSPSNRAMDETQWQVAPYTEQDLQSQIDNAQRNCQIEAPPTGFPASQCPGLVSTLLSDVGNYVDGINGYITKATNPLNTASLLPGEYAAIGKVPQPWTKTDIIAEASLIGGIFGRGGGAEVSSALVLQALQKRLGLRRGQHAWSDLREANDPEAPTTILHTPFPYETDSAF